MDISVVVSTYNRLGYLRRQLHCFNSQTCDSFEVIIADDGSDDETEAWCKRKIDKQAFNFPLRYVRQKHKGFRLAAVRNLGTKIAEGKRILFTDNDCWHGKRSLAAHATQIGQNTIGVGLIHWLSRRHSRIILNCEAPLPTEKIMRLTAKGERRTFKKKPLAIEVWGGNFSIDKQLLEKAGGHDEAFNGYGGEEIDLALRLTRHFDQSKVHILWKSITFHLWHERKKVHNQKVGQTLLSKRRSGGYYKQKQLGSL